VELEDAREDVRDRERLQRLPVPLPPLVDAERQDLPRQVDVPQADPVELRRPAGRPQGDLDGRPWVIIGWLSESQGAFRVFREPLPEDGAFVASGCCGRKLTVGSMKPPKGPLAVIPRRNSRAAEKRIDAPVT